MLLLLCRQGAWPNKRPRPMPAGPGGKGVVVELLAHDSFHGPAEAGHVREVDFARAFDHGDANSTAIAQNQEMCGINLHPGGEPHSGAACACFASERRGRMGGLRWKIRSHCTFNLTRAIHPYGLVRSRWEWGPRMIRDVSNSAAAKPGVRSLRRFEVAEGNLASADREPPAHTSEAAPDR